MSSERTSDSEICVKSSSVTSNVEHNCSEEATERQQYTELERPPRDDYLLIGFDVDTTGRKLRDDLFLLAAYTPSDEYFGFIMPFGSLNYRFPETHGYRIVTIGSSRVLRDFTNRLVHTKSEHARLLEFVNWLEKMRKDSNKNSVLLVNFQPAKWNIQIFLDRLEKNQLMDQFKGVVSGFVDGFLYAKAECGRLMYTISLSTLMMVLFAQGRVNVDCAIDRAEVTYRIVHRLIIGTKVDMNNLSFENVNVLDKIWPYTVKVDVEYSALLEKRVLLEKEKELRPLFGRSFGSSSTNNSRMRALRLRKYLTDADITFEDLRTIFDEQGNEGIDHFIGVKLIGKIPIHEVSHLQNRVCNYFKWDYSQSTSYAQRMSTRGAISNVSEEASNGSVDNEQKFSPVVEEEKGVNLEDTEEVSPVEKDKKGSPAEKDKDGSPAEKDKDGSPAEKDKDGSPAEKDKEGSPAEKDKDGSPAEKDKDGSPAEKDVENGPMESDEEGFPVKKNEDQCRMEKDVEHFAEKDEKHCPAEKNEEHCPEKDEEGGPAKKDEEGGPAKKDEEHGPMEKDEKQRSLEKADEHGSVEKGKEHGSMEKDQEHCSAE